MLLSERRKIMEKSTLIKEIMWEYDTTKAKAKCIVAAYELYDKYEDLCELVKTKQDISVIVKDYAIQ